MPRASWRQLLLTLLPALAAFAVYANTLDAEFVYDDGAQIVYNPWVRELRNLPKAISRPVWAFNTSIPTNYFRPLQMGAYNLMWAASGGRPFLFHLLNVLLHVTATVALARLVLAVTRDRTVAAGAGLLFAVHPLSTEAVAWIACLPELGYAAFGLIALSLHVEGWEAPPGRRSWLRAGEVLSFALALVSKETAATLVALVFLLELWVRPCRPRRAIRACAPHLILVGLYGAVRLIALGGLAPLRQTGLTAWDAVLNGPWLLLSYLGKMIWPARLVAYHVFERVTTVAQPAFFLGLLGLALIVAGVLWLSRRRGGLAFACALALLPLLPVLYVPAIGLNVFAERYAYLPTAGFTWLVAAALLACAAKLTARRAPAVALLACLVLSVPAALHSVARNRIWHDDERLAATTVRQSPRSRVMWGLLAGTYRASGRPEQALEVYEEALRLFPGDAGIRADIVDLQITLRRISPIEAVRRLEAVLGQGPVVYETYVHLGLAHSLAGNPAAAERAYRRALELNPSSKPAYDGLAIALIAQGRGDIERTTLDEGAGFSLGSELDRLIEGAAHLEARRFAEAERAFKEVLVTFPDSAGALFSLAVVAARRADHPTAIDLCRKALAIRPELVGAYQQLGLSAMALGRSEEAIEALERAVEINPYDKAARNHLGVAYARAGRLDDARRAWTAALELDPDFEGARFNLDRLESSR